MSIRKMLVAMSLVAFSAGLAYAAAPAAPKAKKAPAPKIMTVMGSVEAVDAVAGKLSVKDKAGAVKDFEVPATIKIKAMGKRKPVTLAEVTVGDNATVKYTEVEGKVEVKSVMVKMAKKAAAPKK